MDVNTLNYKAMKTTSFSLMFLPSKNHAPKHALDAFCRNQILVLFCRICHASGVLRNKLKPSDKEHPWNVLAACSE